MTTYAIGDIQGCYKEFKKLLKEIRFNPNQDKLWLTGDLVNRGPNSLDVIKYVMELGSSAITVLGNHDFYLLATYYKAAPWPYKNNDFDEILSNKDVKEIIYWLRNRNIIYIDNQLNYILVHAGIHPSLKFTEIMALGSDIEKSLRGSDCKKFIESLWSNKPNKWNKDLSNEDKKIFCVNVFTRMRYLKKDLSLNFIDKAKPNKKNSNDIIPWYEIDNNILEKYKVIIGHWSTIGFQNKKNFVSIDTGCVWGNKLTAIEIICKNKIKKYQIKC